MQQWYVKFPREEIGPIADNQLIAFRELGHVTRETLLHNGNGQWTQACKVKGLFTTPPEPITVKNICPFCKAELAEGAIKCRYCGEFTDGRIPKPEPAQQSFITQGAPAAKVAKWHPGVAAVLSLVIPGAGQMYKGQVLDGIVWFFLVFFAYGFGIGSGIPLILLPSAALHIFCIVSASQGNPYK